MTYVGGEGEKQRAGEEGQIEHPAGIEGKEGDAPAQQKKARRRE
jgi:hypothetical protein